MTQPFCEPPPQGTSPIHQGQDWLFRLSRFICSLGTGTTGSGGGGAVNSVSTTDPALTISPTTGDVIVSTNDFVGDSGSGGVHGDVPAPAAGDSAAGKFLDAGGGWSVPAGASAVTEVDGTAPISTTNPTGPTVTVTHNTSGVTAATYGDSTHVAQVAINATGHVTLASNVAISAGTVTSVGLSLPAEFTVSGTPVTTSGTLTGVWASETQHFVFAAPSGSSGTPSFRALVSGDLPAGTGTVTSIATTSPILGGTITTTGTISHATSGVSATTYGDSTHVAQIAVNATGHITSASNVGIAGVVAGASLLYALVFGG